MNGNPTVLGHIPQGDVLTLIDVIGKNKIMVVIEDNTQLKGSFSRSLIKSTPNHK
jgi:hypothetical protein